ncbi:MAG: metallophosphoesterase family protein [Anaerolineae bacterium]
MRAGDGEIGLTVLADVHGNLPALEAVLADVGHHNVNDVIVAGDLVGGPRPLETIRLLRTLSSWIIQGNSDASFVRYAQGKAPSWHTSLQHALLRWGVRQLDGETLDFLASLPEQRVINLPGTEAIRVVHGSPHDPAESLYPDRDPAGPDAALAQMAEPVLICGHTHEPWVRQRGNRLALNPGSVAGPLDGYVGAQYALLKWRDSRWQAELRTVSYDLDRIRADFEDSGLPEDGGALARAFLLGVETGQNATESFLSHARRVATSAGFSHCTVIPDVAWRKAEQTFDWDGATRATVARGGDNSERP